MASLKRTLAKEKESQPMATPLLSDDADYWLSAPKEEVRKYLEVNTNIEEYEQKKNKLLCEIKKKLK